jgi:DNA gyrase/topoisomerase IV subunit B
MSDFKVLSDKEHCLKRPNMYIGSIDEELIEQFVFGKYQSIPYVAGLAKIINEVIDNAVDEAIRTKFKHANQIKVDINNHSVTITDNGRGIPQDEVIDTDGSKIPRPVAAWTKTKAGSNFNDDENRVTIGLNGVGSALTNFFSTKFVGKTCDGKRTLTVTCVNNSASTSVNIIDKVAPSGTQVTFIPDFDRFGCLDISEELQNVIHDRITSLQICYPNIKFKFNGKQILESTFAKYGNLYSDHLVFSKSSNCNFFIFPSDGYRQNSFVNGVQTKSGGTHTIYIMNMVVENLIPMIKRKYKIDVPNAMVKVNLGLVVFLNELSNPKFDSQTKERLTNSIAEIKRAVIDVDFEAIAKGILAKDEIINPIIDSILAKKIAADNRAASLEQKKLAKKKVTGHIKANGRTNTTLFLTEGMSASGFFINVRDSNKHGLFPLRGKIPNTKKMSKVDILKNAELSSIMKILGLEYGKRCLAPHYDSIAIMVDADHDGLGSIYPLLINFFSEWSELFEDKRIKFIKTPTVIAKSSKGVKWFHSMDDYRAAKLPSSYKVRIIKGLGSLELDEYSKIIHEPLYDIVELDDIGKLEMLFGEDSQPRKDWMTS